MFERIVNDELEGTLKKEVLLSLEIFLLSPGGTEENDKVMIFDSHGRAPNRASPECRSIVVPPQ
jgi:hypothetical protein